MKTILCFGDSNTYGLKPDGSGRFDFSIRYPGRLQRILGEQYHIIEEGCPGRTTVFEEPERPYKKGVDYIIPCLLSHNPIDCIIVMLGTNDCKSCFRATGKEIASGLLTLIKIIKDYTASNIRILIVSPIHLGENIGKPEFDQEFDETSILTAKTLANEYRELSEIVGCEFLDASLVTRASPIDEEHLDASGHTKLAEAIAEKIVNTMY